MIVLISPDVHSLTEAAGDAAALGDFRKRIDMMRLIE
jgi:hypothetical protein